LAAQKEAAAVAVVLLAQWEEVADLQLTLIALEAKMAAVVLNLWVQPGVALVLVLAIVYYQSEKLASHLTVPTEALSPQSHASLRNRIRPSVHPSFQSDFMDKHI